MKRFRSRLEELRNEDPRFDQAVDNALRDVQSAENPHGNLTPPLVVALDGRCHDDVPLEPVIGEHCCNRRPELHRRSEPTPDPVRRVMPRSDFIQYHLLGPGAANEESLDHYRRQFAPGRHQESTVDWGGSSGLPDRPSWWTFEEEGRAAPADGKTLLLELALGERARDLAERDGAVVDLGISPGELEVEFFKPTSLEGFGPETLFRPELSEAPYGRTEPVDEELEGRPEIVSRSFRYDDLREELPVEVRVLNFKPRS